MTFITYRNDCIPSAPINATKHDRQFDPVTVALLAFSTIAIILEVIALIVLCHSRGRRFGSLRKSLITLTAIEMWLNFSIFTNKAWENFGLPKYNSLSGFICSFLLFGLLNDAICSRNWAVTLIALARCEVITRPVAHRVNTHIFSPNRQLIYIVILIIIGAVLSFSRLLYRPAIVCTNLDGIIRHVDVNETQLRVSNKFFMSYQSAIPIVLVTLATIFMIITLLRSSQIVRKNSSAEPKKSDGKIISSVYQQKKKKTSIHLSKQVRATRAILLITGIFILCEAPIFFVVLFDEYLSIVVIQIIYQSLKFLIVFDTYANFIIYLLTSKHFRNGLKKLFSCQRDDYLLRPTERAFATTRSVMTPHGPLLENHQLPLNASSSGDNGSAI